MTYAEVIWVFFSVSLARKTWNAARVIFKILLIKLTKCCFLFLKKLYDFYKFTILKRFVECSLFGSIRAEDGAIIW